MALIGDDWRTIPAELDERPMPPSRERSFPPQHSIGDDGTLPDELHHWEEVWREW
ncbi:MAG: hypothetical protein ABIO99_10465 [Candidatus Limnocylindria bacterium]